jgi:DNA polymerase I-like protein with 3'-5' exonuclease and polymerase domains
MLLQQMDDRVSVSRDWFQYYTFHLVQSIEQLNQLVDICIKRGLYAIDTETTGVDNRVYPDSHFEDGKETKFGIRTVDRIVGVCISFDGQHGYYAPLSHEPEDSENLPWDEAWEVLTRLINSEAKAIFHNSKFDCEFLYPLTGREYWALDQYEDTYFMAKIINPIKTSPAGLKPLTKIHYGIEMVELDELFTAEKKEQLKRQKKRYNFALLHPREGLEYGCSDGIFTYKLYHTLKDKLQGFDPKIYDLEKTFCNVLRKMERNRVHIDVDRVNQLYSECKEALQETGSLVRKFIESRTGNTGKWLTLNIGSVSQLSKAFFTDPEGMKLRPTKEMLNPGGDFGFGGGSNDDSDDDVHEIQFGEDGKPKQYSLKDEMIKTLHRDYGERTKITCNSKTNSVFEFILEYRHYEKMAGSFIEKFLRSHDKHGDVRPNFNQLGTDTSRLSATAGEIKDGFSGVNFQGIPRDSDEDKPELFKQIRSCISTRPGWILVKIDYAGEELRVVTNMSGDPIWTESFLHGDGDVHAITSRTLFGKKNINKDERNRGKRCNFAFIYGGGAGAIMRNVGCSIEDAQRHMNNLRNDVPVLMGYVDCQKQFTKKHKCIYTAFGRRIPIPTIDSPIKAIRSKAERCAINYTIQATSADILKLAMCFVDKQIRTLGWEDKVRYVLTVHDEVVFEVKPEFLMEVIPKLVEWMVKPGAVPKAHGRQWVVPLETEPGIDTHWRARFDFNHMVDGVIPKPKDLDEKGNYIGKLKGNQYFADGKIYQKVPDFLQRYIWRKVDGVPKVSEPKPDPEPDLDPKLNPEPKPESSPQPESGPQLESNLNLNIKLGSIETTTSQITDNIDVDIDVGFSDLVLKSEEPTQTQPKPITVSEPAKLEQAKSELAQIKPTPGNGNGGGSVLRWTIRAVLTENSMKKLYAICVLAEGSSALRILSNDGKIILSESEGVMVNPDRFKILSELFGL